MAKKLGLGIIGCGSRGVYFGAKDMGSDSDFNLVALCDVSEEKLAAAKEMLGKEIRTYTDRASFLKDPELEVVVIASPDFTHADVAVDVLKAKKHLYLEKPMAQKIEDCDRIIKAWEGSGSVFMVGLELRYCVLFKKVKELLDAGEIGQIQIGTVVDNVSVGGDYFFHNNYRYEEFVKTLVLQKGTHSLDLANWFIGSSPVKVYASAGLNVLGQQEEANKHCKDCDKKGTCPYFMDPNSFTFDYGQKICDTSDYCVYGKDVTVSDNSLVTIDYANGARLTYMECHFTPEYTREFMFVGDKGKLEAFFNNEQEFKIKVWKRFEKEPTYYYPPKTEGGHGGGDAGIIREFARLVREGKPCMKGVKGARDSAAIAIASYESEKSGLPVTIPPMEYKGEIDQ